MILFGWNTLILRQAEHKELLCPICSHKGGLTFFLMCRIYHFFFIPFFPDKRYVYAVCRHCREEISEMDVEKQDRLLFKIRSYKEHAPLFAWSGSLLLLIFILYCSLT